MTLADMLLKRGDVDDWMTACLNRSRFIKGPLFSAGQGGQINWRRKKRHLIGHYDEITRGCFQYQAR